jgi:membrane protein DedA with SNARE-associated domain
MPDISQFISDWGYAGIFLVVILGNILPIPEETVLAVAGYLVWSGRLQLAPVFVVAFVSAVASDNLGYWLGRRYGRAGVERYARRRSCGEICSARYFSYPTRLGLATRSVTVWGRTWPMSSTRWRLSVTSCFF